VNYFFFEVFLAAFLAAGFFAAFFFAISFYLLLLVIWTRGPGDVSGFHVAVRIDERSQLHGPPL
jgi:hypothetical protein